MPENIWSVLIVPVVIALIGMVTGVYSLVLQRRKLSAETSEVITRASGGLVEQYERRMKAMESEQELLTTRLQSVKEELEMVKLALREKDQQIALRDEYIEQLLRGIHRLVSQLKAEDRVPTWEPQPRKDSEL